MSDDQQTVGKTSVSARGDREIVGEIRLQNHAVSLKVTQRERDDLSSGIIQIKRLQRQCLLAEQCS